MELNWIKSSRSYDWRELKCVELAELPDGRIAFRNSKDPHGPTITYTRNEMKAFLASVKDGEFDHLTT